ncbi:DUF4115 domain-containing protein [Haematospirillum sp. H4485]|nr:DUF4115 domain-containing protein [Haematospirillum sp. H4890]NKD74545.1 DUF4115 domain-containing protein [Haematospirillum sp. H4485]
MMIDVLKSPDTVLSRVGEVGRLLREAREESRQNVSDVSDRLRIRSAFLVAIEEGRYNELPGPTYAVGFVRAYAGFLGLDSAEVVRRFREESAMVPGRSHLEFPGPATDGGMPSRNLLVAAVVMVGLVYGGWRLVDSTDTSLAVLVQEVPDRFMSLINGGTVPVVDTGDEPVLREPEMPGHVDADEGSVRMAPAQDADHSVLPLSSDPVPSGILDAEERRSSEPEPLDAKISPDNVPGEEAGKPVPGSAVGSVGAADPAGGDAASARAGESLAPDSSGRAADAAVPLPTVDPVVPAAPSVSVEQKAQPVPPMPLSRPTPPSVRRDPQAAPVERRGSAAAPSQTEVSAVPLRVPGNGAGTPRRIVLRATQDSWVQVRSPQGLVLSRLMRRGEELEVPNRKNLELMTGNAGGLRVEVDGAVMPLLGKAGEVRRNIPLDPDALRTAENPAG